MRSMIVVLGLLFAPVATASDAPAVELNTSVRLVLGKDGAPREVTVPPDSSVPEGLRGWLAEQVGQWRFEATGGKAFPDEVVTNASLRLCMAGDARDPQDLQVAIEYLGLGPRVKGAFIPPRYPTSAARNGYSARIQVNYLVQPDGRATLERMTFLDAGQKVARREAFGDSIRQWVKDLRYEPELIDGEPVAARLQSQVSFSLGEESLEQMLADQKRRKAEMTMASCTSKDEAASDHKRTIVLQPSIQRIPTES